MAKRGREDDVDSRPGPSKRSRPANVDHLSRLSDELTLRVLSYLPVAQLVVCQRLSRKYQGLAGDNQLWKRLYYERFVRPRASRLPGIKDGGVSEKDGEFASRTSRWLGDEQLLKRGGNMKWKRQYKLKHNWTKGSAVVSEIPVAKEATIPPVLVQMHQGVIYMADSTGLRAWSVQGEQRMVAQTQYQTARTGSPPTALAIDPRSHSHTSRITVGFESGAFSIYTLNQTGARFQHIYSLEAASNGVISAVAIAWPYVVTMTATQILSLYRFDDLRRSSGGSDKMDPPRLLHSLRSSTIWPPLSTSLRTTENGITISVAYALPTYLSGWTVGLQEVRIAPDGDLIDSRLASAIGQHYRPLAFSSPPLVRHLPPPSTNTLTTSNAQELRHIHAKPTSLSYTHPYLLASHPDNTLTLYLVTSTAESLSISAGSRLWGHTSSVSGAHVGDRGKAVSVSTRGDELRLWELEGGFASSAAKKRLAGTEMSVRIRPEPRTRARRASSTGANLDVINQALAARAVGACATEQHLDDVSELTLTRGWVGFDEENVVVLKEQSAGRQALVVYDFT
ncbi:hypothetical protein LTR53_010851 [Teratosphaeriaceae sp. CCFEE 6253]|nr:hypothetical protein LTR53_010851 [Teratosphaeriaceae sp. CCFEE 6253]